MLPTTISHSDERSNRCTRSTHGGQQRFDQFTGTDTYIVSPDLRDAVNVAMALQRPLLVNGEPGTGKTLLAHNMARAFGKSFLIWNIKSTTKAKDGLYTYTTRCSGSTMRVLGTAMCRTSNAISASAVSARRLRHRNKWYCSSTKLTKQTSNSPTISSTELDEMQFHILETDEWIVARQRPIVIITSNAEKELPDAFLRRCVFHYIAFPGRDLMADIVQMHFPRLRTIYCTRCWNGSTNYVASMLCAKSHRPQNCLTGYKPSWPAGSLPATERELPFLGVLLKKESDVEVLLKKGVHRWTRAHEAARRMFLDVFYTLRRHKIPVSLTEWSAPHASAQPGFCPDLEERFYTLARALFVKDVSYYDAYDLAFQETFHGIETPDAIIDEILAWLQDPHTLAHLTSDQLPCCGPVISKRYAHSLPSVCGSNTNGRPWEPDDWYGWYLAFRPGCPPSGDTSWRRGGTARSYKSRQSAALKTTATNRTLDVRQLQVALKKLRHLQRLGHEGRTQSGGNH